MVDVLYLDLNPCTNIPTKKPLKQTSIEEVRAKVVVQQKLRGKVGLNGQFFIVAKG